MSIAWQLIPYCVLTISEILVSTTGLGIRLYASPGAFKKPHHQFLEPHYLCRQHAGGRNYFFFLSNGESANAISTDRFILYAVLAAVVAVAYSFRARRYGKTE